VDGSGVLWGVSRGLVGAVRLPVSGALELVGALMLCTVPQQLLTGCSIIKTHAFVVFEYPHCRVLVQWHFMLG
jgi:hypothetical protein